MFIKPCHINIIKELLKMDYRIIFIWIIVIATPIKSKKMNVLFFVSDDMRPEINSFMGHDFPSPTHPKMHTPNLDMLYAKSLVLKRAYVQQAVCSPSRTSLLTGRRPDTTHVYDLVSYFRDVGGNFTTIPQYFKDNGYMSVGMGKIFHPGSASHHDDPISWSVPYYHAPNLHQWSTKNISWLAVRADQRKQRPLPDEQIAQHAIETLQKLAPAAKSGQTPFFLAVGFHKPHLPFVFPEEFLEYYPMEDIRLPDNAYAPVNMPDIAWTNYGELRDYYDIQILNATGDPNTTLPQKIVKNLRRAYYSALSYTDAMMGEVLAELEKLGLSDNTIVSFWGDHGWQLGEHGEWAKHTNFELATHAPMMIHIPGKTDQGIVTEQLSEYVDLYPTLVAATGLPPMPLCPENSSRIAVCREGESLMPLIENPESKLWKKRVFSQYPRDGDIMGYSMRTNRYRYTEWVKFDKVNFKPMWDKLNATELYDHVKDSEENDNVAQSSEYKVIATGLSKMLHEGWRKSM